jgi:hypothetical protein
MIETPEQAREHLRSLFPPRSILFGGGCDDVPATQDDWVAAWKRVRAADAAARRAAANEPALGATAERDEYVYAQARTLGIESSLTNAQLDYWDTIESYIANPSKTCQHGHLPGCPQDGECIRVRSLPFTLPLALTDRFCPGCIARARRTALAADAEQRQDASKPSAGATDTFATLSAEIGDLLELRRADLAQKGLRQDELEIRPIARKILDYLKPPYRRPSEINWEFLTNQVGATGQERTLIRRVRDYMDHEGIAYPQKGLLRQFVQHVINNPSRFTDDTDP